MNYNTQFFLILLASYLAWSKLVNIFIECRGIIIKTFTWVCWTQTRFFLAQTLFFRLVCAPVKHFSVFLFGLLM